MRYALPLSNSPLVTQTEYIAAWLAETAAKVGFKLPLLKGKAREAGTHPIRVRDFVPMAETIARHTPQIPVPGALSKLFERAIGAQKKAAHWISKSRKEHCKSLELSKQTHAHFIDILSNVALILQPLVRERPPQTSGPGQRRQRPDVTSTREMTNLFSSLAVEGQNVSDDLEEESDNATRPEEPLDTLPAVNPVEFVQDESEPETELFFAIQSFLDNLNELRWIVKGTWFDYKKCKVDMVHASIIANTSIDLVRHAESEFDMFLKRPAKYPSELYPVGVLSALLLSTQHGGNFMPRASSTSFCFPAI